MPGDPESSYPAQRKPYYKIQKDGRFYDKDGNIVSGKSAEAHIPFD